MPEADLTSSTQLRRAPPVEGALEPDCSSSHDGIYELADRMALELVLGGLPRAEAEVIGLAFFGGMSHVEIAKQLGLSEERVAGRIRLGTKRLHRAMDASR